MKLRKAIDKAKRSGGGESRKLIKLRTATTTKPQSVNWHPPDYSESACVLADPGHMLKNKCVCIGKSTPVVDAYKVLRTKIDQVAKAKKWKTIMITSARPREGKTLTAINLALSFAKAYNQTVLLVDCDLQNQFVQHHFGIDGKYGLMDHLEKNVPLKDIILWPGIEKITFISGGSREAAHSAEILGSPRMKLLVDELKSRYADRYVLFDTPPVLGSADALSLAPFVDCILMVVEQGRTAMQDIDQALEVVPKEKFLGFALNRTKQVSKETAKI